MLAGMTHNIIVSCIMYSFISTMVPYLTTTSLIPHLALTFRLYYYNSGVGYSPPLVYYTILFLRLGDHVAAMKL